MASPDLTKAIAALRLAEPDLGLKAITARLKEEQPSLEINAKLVR